MRKLIRTIDAGRTDELAVFEHDLGPDVIVQVRSERGRILKMSIDVLDDRIAVHFKNGTTEQLKVVIIG